MINHEEQARRTQCMRRWYYNIPDCARRSAERRLICARTGISTLVFYYMLSGYTYINNERANIINQVINRSVIPGLETDIFAR